MILHSLHKKDPKKQKDGSIIRTYKEPIFKTPKVIPQTQYFCIDCGKSFLPLHRRKIRCIKCHDIHTDQIQHARQVRRYAAVKARKLKLSKEDSLQILNDLANPKPANEALKAAFKDHQENIISDLSQ